MKDVAAAAGCSQTTVSLVLGGRQGGGISETTRRRVAEAAVALGYAPVRATAAPGVEGPSGWKRRSAHRPKPANASFTDRIARTLAIRILSGRYPETGTLPSDPDLIAEFGVSRTVLREAIKVLTGRGFWRRAPGWAPVFAGGRTGICSIPMC